MTTTMTTIEIDADHPTIGAFGVCSKQGGFLPVDKVLEALKTNNIPSELHPVPVGNSTALKRAMEDACQGDKSLRVESTGKHSKVVYSLIRTNKERIDLEKEDNDGRGVADADVSARVEADGVGGLSLVIKPEGHHLSDLIRDKFEFHREHYKCSEDLSNFLSQRVFKSRLVNAVSRPGHAGGFYFVPKGDGLDLLIKLNNVFTELSYSSGTRLYNGVKLYFIPMLTGTQDVLDAVVDSVIDDAEKIIADLECAIAPDSKLGARALGTKAKQAVELKNKIAAFTQSMTLAVPDILAKIDDLEVRIMMAELRADEA